MAEVSQQNNETVDDRFVPGLSADEEKEMAAELENVKLDSETSEMPQFPDYPLFDLVKELKLDEYPEEDAEFYKDLESKPITFYSNMKDVPDSMAKKYYPVSGVEIQWRW